MGNIFIDQNDIENCFIDYYKNLWSSFSDYNLDNFTTAMPNDFPTLSIDDGVNLTRHISKREVYKTLSSMPRDKTLGPDGLNVKSYR